MRLSFLCMAVFAFGLMAQPVASQTARDADFDGTGIVDFADFLMFAAVFGARQGNAYYEPMFDLNGNGEIGFGDFLLFAAAFGKRV